MKLWLQVLFAQGYLWRDRFPEKFTEAKSQEHLPWKYVAILFQVVLFVLGIAALANGKIWAIGVVLVAASWFLWGFSSRSIKVDAGRKEALMSLAWASGLLFCVSVLVFLALAVATAQWLLMPGALVLIVCLSTGWLRAVERNYLLFRQPDEYAWVLEGTGEQPKGLMAPYAHAIADTYWRLPKQILFPKKERHGH